LDSAFREAPWGDYDPIVTEPDRIPIPAPPQPELYNIANDPCEQNDLAATDPVRVRRMMSSLESWFEDVEADRRSIGGPWAEGAS
jgi:hypothetical protein